MDCLEGSENITGGGVQAESKGHSSTICSTVLDNL